MRLSRPVWLTPSMAVLIGANVMVFYGIFELKWDVFALVFLFWLENAIIGIFNILKMLFNRPDSVLNWVIKFFYIPFFTFHYGMFTLVHGIFVVVLHIAIIGSGFLLTLYGEPLYGLLLLAVLKILFDGWSHYWEHRRMQKYKEGRMTA